MHFVLKMINKNAPFMYNVKVFGVVKFFVTEFILHYI